MNSGSENLIRRPGRAKDHLPEQTSEWCPSPAPRAPLLQPSGLQDPHPARCVWEPFCAPNVWGCRVLFFGGTHSGRSLKGKRKEEEEAILGSSPVLRHHIGRVRVFLMEQFEGSGGCNLQPSRSQDKPRNLA